MLMQLIWKISREIAEQQIASGALRGYLAYVGGEAIGWCNANDKANFPIDSCGETHFHSDIPNREIAVVCFEVAPNFRGQGVATALLNRVISDAKPISIRPSRVFLSFVKKDTNGIVRDLFACMKRRALS